MNSKKKKKKAPSNFAHKLAGRKLVWMVRNNPPSRHKTAMNRKLLKHFLQSSKFYIISFSSQTLKGSGLLTLSKSGVFSFCFVLWVLKQPATVTHSQSRRVNVFIFAPSAELRLRALRLSPHLQLLRDWLASRHRP